MLEELEKKETVQIAGAMYYLTTGVAEFLRDVGSRGPDRVCMELPEAIVVALAARARCDFLTVANSRSQPYNQPVVRHSNY